MKLLNLKHMFFDESELANQGKILGVSFIISVLAFVPIFIAEPHIFTKFVIWVVISRIILVTIIQSFLIIIILRFVKTRITSLFLYMLVLVLLIINYYFEFYGILLYNAGFIKIAKSIFITGVLSLILAPLPLLFFISSYTSNSIKYHYAYPIIYALGMALDAVFTNNLVSYGSNDINGVTLNLFIINRNGGWFVNGWMFSLLYSGIMIVVLTIRVRTKKNYIEVERQQRTFLSGIIFVFFFSPGLFLLKPFPDNGVLGFYWNNAVVNCVLVLGMAFLSYPYIMNKGINYLQPQPFENLMITDEGGNLLYSFNFLNLDTSPFGKNAELFSAGFSAISSLIKESSGLSSSITKVQFKDKLIYTAFLTNVTFLLIVEYETLFIQNRFTNFINIFMSNYHDLLEEGSMEFQMLHAESDLIEITKSSFGY